MNDEGARSRVVVEALAAFVERGGEGLLEHMSDDVVWEDDPAWPDRQVSRGHAEVREVLRERLETTSIEPELEGLEERGDLVLARFRWTALGEASGATTVLLPAVLFDVSGERITRIRFFLSHEQGRQEFYAR